MRSYCCARSDAPRWNAVQGALHPEYNPAYALYLKSRVNTVAQRATTAFPHGETVQVFEHRAGQAVPDGNGVDSYDVSCCFIIAAHAEFVRHSLTYIGSAIRFRMFAQSRRMGMSNKQMSK